MSATEATSENKKRQRIEDSAGDVQRRQKRARKQKDSEIIVVGPSITEDTGESIHKLKKKEKGASNTGDSEAVITVGTSSKSETSKLHNNENKQPKPRMHSTKEGKKRKKDSLAAYIVDPQKPDELLFSTDISTSPESRSVPPIEGSSIHNGGGIQNRSNSGPNVNMFPWSDGFLDSSSFALAPNATGDDILGAIKNMDLSTLGLASGQRKVTGSVKAKSTTRRQGNSGAVITPPSNPTDAAKLLSSKWLSTQELKKLFDEQGLDYKRGSFTATEKVAIQTALETFATDHQISYAEAVDIIFAKRKSLKPEYKTFWSDIASSVPMRPLAAVFNFCKRAYHPLQKQGKWTPEEDEALLASIQELGQFWEKISQKVGRMAGDCRDRYRNHLQNASNRKHGTWTQEEEEQLAGIMEELQSKGEGEDTDAVWTEVVRRMGGTRSRAQVRTKWQDSLRKNIKTDGKRRWLPIDSYILIHKVNDLGVNDDTEIDWKTLRDDTWNLWSAHMLQRRWTSMKRGIDGYENIPHSELVAILLDRKGYMSPSEIAEAIEQTNHQLTGEQGLVSPIRPSSVASPNRTQVISSKEVISDSEIEDESD